MKSGVRCLLCSQELGVCYEVRSYVMKSGVMCLL